jgi:CubicO group peptidase (beta-lactamase class C family)
MAHAADITPDTVRAALPSSTRSSPTSWTGLPCPASRSGRLGDEVVYLKGFGVREAGTELAVDADTIFQIASVSKPFASTAVAALVGDGGITWDSRIADLDPGFRMMDPWVTREVTLRDAFSHRSGMPGQAGDLLEDLGYGRDEILHRFRYLEPTGDFRATYAYTNFMLTQAAVAAAMSADMTWEDLITARVFAPLGMTRTSPREADFYAADNRAVIHAIADGVATPRYQRRPDAQSPAGGMSSTVRDMANWMVLQLNDGMFEGEQVVDAAALATTHTPQIVKGRTRDGRASFYGLGYNVEYGADGLVRVSHAGAFFSGVRTDVTLLPGEKLGIVVLANAFPTGAPEVITNAFLDTLHLGAPREDYLALYEPIFAAMLVTPDYPVPADPVAALPAAAYAGLYTNDYYGDAEVSEDEGGALVLTLGPDKRPFALRHLDRDAFTFEFVGLGDEGTHDVLASFASADGRGADSLTLDVLDAHGQGTFNRAATQ